MVARGPGGSTPILILALSIKNAWEYLRARVHGTGVPKCSDGFLNKSQDSLQDGKNGPEEDNGAGDDGPDGYSEPDYSRQGGRNHR